MSTTSARKILFCLPIVFLIVWLLSCASCGNDRSDTMVLARVEVPGTLQDIKLPVYAELEDGNKTYYVLVIASIDQLRNAGVSFRVIDRYTPGTGYLLAESEDPEDYAEALKEVKVLYNDGHWLITRYGHDVDEKLGEIGFDLKYMRDTPIVVSAGPSLASRKTGKVVSLSVNPTVKAMMDKIKENDVREYISELSGETPMTVTGEPHTVITRHTDSGDQVEKASRYIYEQLKAIKGMNVSFQQWAKTGYENRNVVGEFKGARNPDEIIVLIAHLDSINNTGETKPAPGADDDASGCAALLLIADAMSGGAFNRTIRFVFTTGEEQGTLGSQAYVSSVKQQNIVAVFNLDMIAYNTQEAVPTQRVKVRNAKNVNGNRADMVIANTYKKVVDIYGLNASINVIITADGDVNGDQSSFWDEDMAAVWVIEDDYGDFNQANMHSPKDRLATLNVPYSVAQIKATLGAAAHLAGLP